MNDHHDPQPNSETEADDADFVSKSQRKREAAAAQELGEKLLTLSPESLSRISLPDTLEKALDEARRIKKHGALKRQLQYIGKIMRKLDLEPIQQAYDRVSKPYRQDVKQFHHVEQWRDRLLQDGDRALEALLQEQTMIDRQHVRQLIRQSHKESKLNKPAKSARELFRYLKQQFEQS